MIRLYGSKHSVKNCRNVSLLLKSTVSDVTVDNLDTSSSIYIEGGADNIIMTNCHGPIVIELGATNIVTIGCTGSITGAGAGVVVKLIQAAANADTSGATLGQLETEVNELKTLLRNTGLLAT